MSNDEERSEMRYVVRIAEFSESSNLWTQMALPASGWKHTSSSGATTLLGRASRASGPWLLRATLVVCASWRDERRPEAACAAWPFGRVCGRRATGPWSSTSRRCNRCLCWRGRAERAFWLCLRVHP